MGEHDYIAESELEAIRADLAEHGFERDPLVAEQGDRPYAGVNLAVAWPLGASLEPAYLDFAAGAKALDDGVYVYPFSTTHVTVVTAVNFKRNPHPTPDTILRVESAARRLGEFLDDAARDLSPFALDIGPPALARAAAFLPIRNPTGEIARLRERGLAFCRHEGGILADASVPRSIHSTVLRFREAPRDAASFARAFAAIASRFHPGSVVVDRVLVTLETKPYMRAGRVARSVALGDTG